MEYESWFHVAERAEQQIAAKLSTRSQDRWEENSISDDVIAMFQHVLHGSVAISRAGPSTVTAMAYKANGKVENRYGDVAVLVNVKWKDGLAIEGVAFYEAKKRHWSEDSLPGLRKRAQLERMNKNLKNAHLLVYEREPQTVTHGGPVIWLHPGAAISTVHLLKTHAVVVRLNDVLAHNRFDRAVYQVGEPLSYQVALRNLAGRDLDYDKDALALAKGQAEKRGVPRYVLGVGVSYGAGQDAVLPSVEAGLFDPLVG